MTEKHSPHMARGQPTGDVCPQNLTRPLLRPADYWQGCVVSKQGLRGDLCRHLEITAQPPAETRGRPTPGRAACLESLH